MIRSYPDSKKSLEFTKSLSEKHEDLNCNDAKISFLWLLGVWCTSVTNSGQILQFYREKFENLSYDVQLQLLNSGVKMYIKEIEPVESILSALLQEIAESSDYPDLRDRAFFYWRILSESDGTLAEDLVFTELPNIKFDEQIKHNQAYYIDQLKSVGKLSGAMQSSNPSDKNNRDLFGEKKDFVKRGTLEVDSETFNMPAVESIGKDGKTVQPQKQNDRKNPAGTSKLNLQKNNSKEKAMEVDLLDMDFANANVHAATDTEKNKNDNNIQGDFDILNDLNDEVLKKAQDNVNEEEDLFEDDTNIQNFEQDSISKSIKIDFKNHTDDTLIKKTAAGKSGKTGLVVKGRFEANSDNDELYLCLNIKNKSSTQINQLTLQFKPNYFGLKVAKPTVTTIGNLYLITYSNKNRTK